MSAPILVREKQVATIWLVGDASGAAEEWQFFLETGAAAAAIELSRAHAVEETVHRIHGDFVSDLVRGTGDAEVVATRAKRMGFDVSAPHVAIALLPVPAERSTGAKPSPVSAHRSEAHRKGVPPTEAIEEAIQRIGRRIPRVLNAHGVSAPVYREPGLTTVFYPVDETTASASGRRLALRLCGDLARAAAGCELFAGVSGPHSGVAEFRLSYGEAKQSVELARTVMSETQVACYSDLGVYRLLLAARGTPEIRDLYEEMLGSLAAYDQKTKSDLLPTLAAYLRSGNAVEVSQTLNLHRNTLRYRLRRIRDISRLDLDDPDIRLGLQVALKIGDVLGLGKPPSPDQSE
jgi:sugar diacid utilization regulator